MSDDWKGVLRIVEKDVNPNTDDVVKKRKIYEYFPDEHKARAKMEEILRDMLIDRAKYDLDGTLMSADINTYYEGQKDIDWGKIFVPFELEE